MDQISDYWGSLTISYERRISQATYLILKVLDESDKPLPKEEIFQRANLYEEAKENFKTRIGDLKKKGKLDKAKEEPEGKRGQNIAYYELNGQGQFLLDKIEEEHPEAAEKLRG